MNGINKHEATYTLDPGERAKFNKWLKANSISKNNFLSLQVIDSNTVRVCKVNFVKGSEGKPVVDFGEDSSGMWVNMRVSDHTTETPFPTQWRLASIELPSTGIHKTRYSTT